MCLAKSVLFQLKRDLIEGHLLGLQGDFDVWIQNLNLFGSGFSAAAGLDRETCWN